MRRAKEKLAADTGELSRSLDEVIQGGYISEEPRIRTQEEEKGRKWKGRQKRKER